jgi:hypothetical protein
MDKVDIGGRVVRFIKYRSRRHIGLSGADGRIMKEFRECGMLFFHFLHGYISSGETTSVVVIKAHGRITLLAIGVFAE